jgi:hypothetical protein
MGLFEMAGAKSFYTHARKEHHREMMFFSIKKAFIHGAVLMVS